jgi:hypothetical protein
MAKEHRVFSGILTGGEIQFIGSIVSKGVTDE